MPETHIAIIGAGVGGLALASYLSRLENVKITIFERRLSLESWDGGALLMQGEGIEVLRELGVFEAMKAAALADISSSASNEISDNGSSIYFMRDLLLKLLLSTLKGQVNICKNSEVLHITEEKDHVRLGWRPTLIERDKRWERNASTSTSEDIFSFVVGADGNAPASQAIKSVSNDTSSSAMELPLLVLQALVPAESKSRSLEEVLPRQRYDFYQQRLRGNVLVGSLDIASAVGRTYEPIKDAGVVLWDFCTVMIHYRNAMEEFPQGPEAWATVMVSYVNSCQDPALQDKASGLIGQAVCGTRGGRLHSWVPFQKETLSRWSTPGGRIAVLGDAAHRIPPTCGWGANYALGDAQSLANHFEMCLRSGEVDVDELQSQLRNYEEARKSAVEIGFSDSIAEARRIISGGR